VTVLTVLVFALIAVRLLVLVSQLVRSPRPAPPRPVTCMDPCLGPFCSPVPARSPEGELVRMLRCGEISRQRYRREMARLARADAPEDPAKGAARP
jgi:hypothetical protein